MIPNSWANEHATTHFKFIAGTPRWYDSKTNVYSCTHDPVSKIFKVMCLFKGFTLDILNFFLRSCIHHLCMLSTHHGLLQAPPRDVKTMDFWLGTLVCGKLCISDGGCYPISSSRSSVSRIVWEECRNRPYHFCGSTCTCSHGAYYSTL